MNFLKGALDTLVFASSNLNKLPEIRVVAHKHGVTILTSSELRTQKPGIGDPPSVSETASTYYGNALLKSEAFFAWCGLPSIGDDSGIEVDALDGAPGIYSARFAGPLATMEEN